MKKVLCFSVEPEQNRKALSRHGSVEIFDGEVLKQKNETFSILLFRSL